MSRSGNLQPAIDNAEHIGPSDTGDNIEAKRAANYVWNGSSWERQSSSGGGLTDDELRATPVPVSEAHSVIDSNNSTTATLGSGGVFTGTSTDVSGYAAVVLQVFSNRASATRGLSIQCSTDGTNWDHEHSYTYSGASVGYHFEETLCGNYFRIVYTNTNAAQSVFRLQTKLLKGAAGPHIHPIDYDIDTEHPAAVTRAVITGQTTAGGGGLVNVKVNPSGTLEANVSQATAANLNMTEASAATIATNTGNSATSLAVIDDWDESDRAKVNPIVGQAGVAAGAGTTSSTTQRVVIASDQASSIATESTMTAINGKLPDFSGTWGYAAGTNGTVVLSGSKRVLQITATALEASGTITINGGDTITLPYGGTDKVSTSLTIAPVANLTDPTIVFSSGVDSYFIEHLT